MESLKRTLESRMDFGVPLSEDESFHLQRKIEELKERVPAKSYVKLRFKQFGNEVRGTLRLSSLYFNFKAVGKGMDAVALYEQLEAEINEQLRIWKQVRFINPNATNGFSGGFAV